MPEAGEYLWNWYFDIARRVARVRDNQCWPIPPTEWLAWAEITGNLVYAWEYGILASMDVAFCEEANKELSARHTEAMAEADRKARRGRK